MTAATRIGSLHVIPALVIRVVTVAVFLAGFALKWSGISTLGWWWRADGAIESSPRTCLTQARERVTQIADEREGETASRKISRARFSAAGWRAAEPRRVAGRGAPARDAASFTP